MLDMGFIHAIRKIIAAAASRQSLLFSATFSVNPIAGGDRRRIPRISKWRAAMPPPSAFRVVHPVDRERKRSRT